MKGHTILTLVLSAGLAAQPVVSALAPTAAYAGVVTLSDGRAVSTNTRAPSSSLSLETTGIAVGTYEYTARESAPFVIGADDEITVKARVGYDFLNKTLELCQSQGSDAPKVLGSCVVTVSEDDGLKIRTRNSKINAQVTCKGSDITSTGTVFLRARYENPSLQYGESTKTCTVPLNVMQRDTSTDLKIPEGLNIGLGQASFTFPYGIDILGGKTVSFGAGTIPFKHQMEKDGTRTATINVSDLTLKAFDGVGGLDALSKAQANYDAMVAGGAGGFAVKSFKPVWKIAAVYRWNPQIPRKNGASLAFSYGLKGGFTASYLIFTGDLDFTGMLGYRGTYGIDYQGNTTVAVGPVGSLNVRLGVGLGRSFIGRVGAYGSATLEAWYLMRPTEAAGWESATLRGEIGAEGVFLGWRIFEWPIVKGGPWHIVEPKHPYLVTASAQALLEGGNLGVTPASEAQPAASEPLSRDYLGHTSVWLGSEQVHAGDALALATAAAQDSTSGLPTSQDDPRVLQESGYPDAQVNIAETPSGKLMVWLRDDPSRSDANRSQLVWSRYDAAADAWSEPQPVDGDATADFDPCLYVDGEGVAHVAWLNADTPLPEGLDVTKTAERLGVSYASLTPGATSFAAAEQVATAQSGEARTSPQLAASGKSVVVGWSTFEAQHLLDLGGTHNVVVAARGDGGWTTRVPLSGTTGAITSLVAGVTGGEPSIAWTEDADGQLNDSHDSTLSVFSMGQTSSKLVASGEVSNAQYVPEGGTEVLTWKGRGEPALHTSAEGKAEGEDGLWKLNAPDGAPEALVTGVSLPSNYQLDGDLNGEAVLSYAAMAGDNAALYGRTLKGGELSEEGVLVDHANNITAWDVAAADDRVAVAFAAERGVGTGSSEADLCVAGDGVTRRLKLERVTVEGDQVPGGTVELVAQVTNVGARTLDGVSLKLLNDGSIVTLRSRAGVIQPGETVELRAPYKLADDFTYDPNRTLSVHACFLGTAGLAGSSVASVPLMGDARFTAEAHDLPYEEQETVEFELTNHGAKQASGTAHVFGRDAQGAERDLGSVSFGPLGAGETQVVQVTPNAASFEADGITYVGLRVESEQANGEVLTGTYTWSGELLAGDEATETGWSFENGSWYVGVAHADGARGRKLGWHWDQGWYYLDPERGGAAVSGWTTIDEKTYWFNTRHDGRFGRMTTGWLFTDGAWYLMAPSGEMVRGWAWDGATRAWYYLAEDGRMLRDTTTPDGERVDAQGRWVA